MLAQEKLWSSKCNTHTNISCVLGVLQQCVHSVLGVLQAADRRVCYTESPYGGPLERRSTKRYPLNYPQRTNSDGIRCADSLLCRPPVISSGLVRHSSLGTIWGSFV